MSAKTTYTHTTQTGYVGQRKSVKPLTHVTVVVVDGEHVVATWHSSEAAARKMTTGGSREALILQSKGAYVEAING